MENETEKNHSITGVILAGGRSSRFGANKALATIGGRPLISHVADLFAQLFSSILVVTNSPAEYAFLNLPMTVDLFPGAGPLAGIHAALSVSKKERIFVAACDMPLLDPDLIRYLCTLSNEVDFQAFLPRLQRGPEPLCGVYHKDLLPAITSRLEEEKGRISDILAEIPVRWVEEEEILSVVPDLDSFRNINYQQDLAGISGGRTGRGES